MFENPLYFVFFIIFCSSCGIIILYYFIFFSKLALYKPILKYSREKLPLSVIICARNQEHNLKKNLIHILQQDYPAFEVIVVNDCSTDNTIFFLQELKKSFPHLEIVNLDIEERFAKGKKFPLTLGIKHAKNELLLLTDADCIPASKHWLTKIQKHFTKNTDIVIGYSPYKRKRGLLNLLIRLDTFLIAVKYLSFSLRGLTYMGVGRNLAYRKSLFFKNKGFASHYHISSGDDDLFISETATPTNTKIEISANSQVFSEPKSSFNDWFKQKQRHLTTAIKYRPKIKFLLGTFSLSDFLFYLSLIFLILQLDSEHHGTDKFHPIIILCSLFFFRYFVQYFFLVKAKKKLNEKNLYLIFLPFFDFFFLLFYGIILSLNSFSKVRNW